MKLPIGISNGISDWTFPLGILKIAARNLQFGSKVAELSNPYSKGIEALGTEGQVPRKELARGLFERPAVSSYQQWW